MNRIFVWTPGAALICMLICAASTAAAERPFTEHTAQISGHLAYGMALDDDDTAGLNPYGFGLGARGGYTFRPNVYVGGVFGYFFGETERAGALGATARASANTWLLQAEVGYDFGVSRGVVLRPKLGLGMTRLMMEGCVAGPLGGEVCADDTDGKFTVAPGLEIPIELGGVFIAPEARFNVGDDVGGFILAFGVGGTF